jgi:hypothetical protein
MSYTKELVQHHNEIVQMLNTISAPLADANAMPSDNVLLAMRAFNLACEKTKVYVALDVNDFVLATELKAQLSASSDILIEAIEEQKKRDL